MNYRQYQQVFQIKEGGSVVKRPGKIIKRSLYGCYHCKKKKKKCDETKPICMNCIKSRLECCWPPKAGVKVMKEGSQGLYCDKSDGTEDSSVKSEEDAERRSTSSSRFGTGESSLISEISGVNEEALMYSCFVNKFLPSILSPHSRGYVLANNMFIIAAQESETLKEIYLVCGAALLAFEKEEFQETARKLYTRAVNSLIEKMKDKDVKGTEDWLFIAIQSLQTLCLRGGSLGFNATTCAEHLFAAYRIIQRRSMLNDKFQGPVENVGIICPQNTNDAIKRSPSDTNFDSSSHINRLLVENFIFNYPVTIMFCQSNKLEKLIPNPFEFFEIYKSWLLSSTSGDNKEESIRVSNLSFEIAAKVSWLFRLCLPLGELDHERCKRLTNVVRLELSQIDSRDFPIESEGFNDSLLIARVVLKSSLIILRKIVDMDGVKVPDIQPEVVSIMDDIKNYDKKTLILPVWALIICGSASSSDKQKDFFKAQIMNLMTLISSNTVLSVMNYLESAWKNYIDDEVFELLFDSETLDSIFA